MLGTHAHDEPPGTSPVRGHHQPHVAVPQLEFVAAARGRRPANTFAARFIGSPAMSLVPFSQNSGRLVQDTATLPPTILDEAGTHDYFDANGTDQVCAALGA
jgi:hypothetical protein